MLKWDFNCVWIGSTSSPDFCRSLNFLLSDDKVASKISRLHPFSEYGTTLTMHVFRNMRGYTFLFFNLFTFSGWVSVEKKNEIGRVLYFSLPFVVFILLTINVINLQLLNHRLCAVVLKQNSSYKSIWVSIPLCMLFLIGYTKEEEKKVLNLKLHMILCRIMWFLI